MHYVYMYIIVVCLLLCCGAPTPLHAQKEADIWYFGKNAGISFTNFAPDALAGSAMETPEGCAAIADVSGKLRFYTDGTTVWTSTHNLMVGGSRLAGNTSTTQSALIIPHPGSTHLFYIFTITTDQDIPLVSYSIVNMDEQEGEGAVTTKNILLFSTRVTEKITAIRHSNKRDIWVLVHERNSHRFYAFLVTPMGINPDPVVSAIGTPHNGDTDAIGSMKASPDGKKVATTIFSQGLEVFDFDHTTGTLSKPLFLSLANTQGYYGVEFSPDGNKVYCSIHTHSAVYQFNLLAGSHQHILASAAAVWQQADDAPGGALQLAPNGKIYRARDKKYSIDVIEQPNALGTICRYSETSVHLDKGQCRLGLPTIFPDYLQRRFFYRNACPGDTTHFRLANPTGIDAVFWEFGDPTSGSKNTASSFTPWHIYPSQGSYTVRLITYAQGMTIDSIEYEVRVLPLAPTGLPRDTTLCTSGDMVLQAENAEYTAYQWSTNEQTPSIRVTAPGTYWVQVSTLQCSRTDTINVHPSSFALGTSPDTVLCAGTPLQLQVTGAQRYFWHAPIAPEHATQATQIVATTATTSYTVTGIDANGCSLTTTLTVVRLPLPVAALGRDTTLCGLPEYALDAGNPGAEYEWSTGARTQRISVSSTGAYWVRISNPYCSVADTIALVFAKAATLTADTTVCPRESVQLQATGLLSYEWSPATGLNSTTIANPIATPMQTTTYTVHGITPEGCAVQHSVTVAVEPHATVSFSLPTVTPTIGATDTRIAIWATCNAPPLVLPPMELLLHIDPQYFAPLSATRGMMVTTSTHALAVITLPALALSGTQELLTEIIGIPLVGNGQPTPITVSMIHGDNCIASTVQQGTLAVQGCIIPQRQVGFTTSTQLLVYAQPTQEVAELRIATADDYGYTLALYDIHGKQHWHYTTASSPPANTFATVLLPTDTLANGSYYLVLTTASAVRSHPLQVLR